MGQIFKDYLNTLGVHQPELQIFVLVVYRLPSFSHTENAELLSFIVSFYSGREVVLLGGFNSPFIDWFGSVPVATSVFDSSFLDMFGSLGQTQWVFLPTLFPPSGNV